jgi:sec-independent protein translocase protein TatA
MKMFEPGGLVVMLIIVLVIFGPTQLPKIATMIGQSSKALRDGIDGMSEEEPAKDTASAAAGPGETRA